MTSRSPTPPTKCRGILLAQIISGAVQHDILFYMQNAEEFDHVKRIAKQFLPDSDVHISRYGNGRINDTYLVEETSGDRVRAILQRLHPIFAFSVLEDTDAITRILEREAMLTPRILPTSTGALGVEDGDDRWRMLSYIDGVTHEMGLTERMAESAGMLVGNFHHVLADSSYAFCHVREGFHDTTAIMQTLSDTLLRFSGTPKHDYLAPIAQAVLREFARDPVLPWSTLPKRVIHGDLKLANIRFDEEGNAIALLDLDTLGSRSIAIDLGDAARSWCNKSDEGDILGARFDLGIFRAMMGGYAGKAKFLTEGERLSVVPAAMTITLELTARFVTDAFEEKYFRHDAENYTSLYEQNKAKAEAQFALYRDMESKRGDMERVIRDTR